MALEKIQCAAGKEVVSVVATCYKQLFCGFVMLGAMGAFGNPLPKAP